MSNEQENQNNQGDQDNGNQGGHDNHDKPKKIIVCSTKTGEDITMTVPVEVRAHVDIGNIVLKCMDKHIVKKPDKLPCISKFEIVQEMHVELPIDYIAEIEIMDEHVDFDVYEYKH